MPAHGTLQVITDFPGGSASVLNIDQENHVIRFFPATHADRGWTCWWYFKLKGVQPGTTVTIEIGGIDFGQPDQAAFSYDDRTWNQTAPGDHRRGHTDYQQLVKTSEVWFAWGPPFGLREAIELVKESTQASRYASGFELCRSREGRSIPGLRISQPGAADEARLGVWIFARQHAWESGSSWVCRGLTEWLVSKDPAAESLRKRAAFTIVPVMDVDNVEIGAGGKDQKPHDQNRDWGTSPYFPEVKALEDQLTAASRLGRVDLLIDLHNPGPKDRTVVFYIPAKPLLSPQRVANEDLFLKLCQRTMTGKIPFIGHLAPTGATYDPAVDKTVDSWTANLCRPTTVALTMETPWNTVGSNQAGYIEVGRELGHSIEQYFHGDVRNGRHP